MKNIFILFTLLFLSSFNLSGFTDIDNYLFNAIRLGNTDKIEETINAGANVNSRNDLGVTPIMVAFQYGNPEVIDLLISNNADLTKKDNYLCSVLYYAIRSKKPDIVKLYFDYIESKNINPNTVINSRNNNFSVPLIEAINQKSFEIVNSLLEQKLDINAKDINGNSILYYAIVSKNADLVQKIIEKGANVNLSNKTRATPLIYACDSTDDTIAKLLIENGANVNKRTYDGTTPLFIAAGKNNYNLVKLLLDNKAKADSNIFYNFYGNTINRSPVINACTTGNVELVKLLFDNGAKIKYSDYTGTSCLFEAISSDTTGDLIIYLIKKGVNVNSSRNDSTTPLLQAVWRNNYNAVKILLENKAIIEYTNYVGQTPVIAGCINSNLNLVKLLISNKASERMKSFLINSRDNTGKSPLYYAVDKNNFYLVKYLVENNANINIKDSLGKSIFEMSLERGFIEISDYLVNFINFQIN